MKMRWPHLLVGALLLALAVWVGRLTAPDHDTHDHGAAATAGDAPAGPTEWTCPMHPEVVLPEFGPCPKCGMDLVVRESGDDPGPRRLALTDAAVALAAIETAPVQRRFVTMRVRLVGKVYADETRVRTIAARVAGRLERLFVDYTGIRVAAGDHLVSLYSPELLVAQQELLEARQRRDAPAPESSAFLRESNERGYQAARDKLLLWGLTADQVDQIEARGEAEDHLLIRSPTAGIVLQKHKDEGDYVAEGTPIYRIADLSKLWVVLEAYERDLPWLRFGQTVALSAEALPGEVFEGRIAFLSPTVDERTRTVRVRVNVDNRDRRLKPGMFATGVVRARIGSGGHVLDVQLSGKWISPMHPEIVKDEPGTCDVCGMDLVPAEELGYVDDRAVEKPLVVPASAVLVTGRRAVVYVQVPGKEKPTFEGREVVLGARAGDDWIVRSGLAENELVAVQGAFRLDSAMQIQAKPSMMSMPGDAGRWTGPEGAAFRAGLRPVYDRYLELQTALAGDDLDAARAAAEALRAAVAAVDDLTLPPAAAEHWRSERSLLEDGLLKGLARDDLAGLRVEFEAVARAALDLARSFGHDREGVLVEAFCPMAFDDRGAAWLQAEGDLRNPYFGAEMLECGEFRTRFPTSAGGGEARGR